MRRITTTVLFLMAVPALTAALAAQGTQPPPAAATSAKTSAIKKFTITLVLGDTQPGSSTGLSAEATKALADLKDFLPYKQYRVLDSMPVLGLSAPSAAMRGMDEQKYYVSMHGVDFGTSSRIDSLSLMRPGAGTLIETSFKITPGETVVVGTSRLEGTQALILLVTAVP